MQITVFGASGKIGSLVVEELLRHGHTVVAFVHNRNVFSPRGTLIVIKGDVYNTADILNALQGSQAVISCLGSWGTPKKNVLTTAMQAVIPAMQEANIDRIVTLTGSGAKAPNEADSSAHKLIMKLTKPFPAGKVFQDGEDHMELLSASTLRWTTLRSPVMNNLKPFNYELNLKRLGPLASISRRAVVEALITQLTDDTFFCQAPLLHRK